MRAETTIEGALERVVYANEESGWSVAQLTVRGRGKVTVVGHLLGARPGETLRVTGRWGRDRRFGEQFKAESVLAVKPATFVGIERYLGSGLIRGLGPTMARRLVQHFGLDTLDVIDRAPQRLAEVEGIGRVRTKRIREAWEEQRAIQEVMVFLQSHGVSTAHAIKIYKRYGDAAVAAVRENPYRLARDVWGIGFRSADKIARDLGIPPDSPHRAAAGLLHVLSEAADEGHVFLPQRALLAAAAELLELPAESLAPAVETLLAEGAVAVEPLEGAGDRAVFPAPLAAAERGLAARILALTAQRPLPLKLDVEAALRWFESRETITLDPEQRRALAAAITEKVLVVTGGPGTGKTTLVRGVVSILGAKKLRVLLAAPTGRAAKRLAEATGAEAKTIHRLLSVQPGTGRFERDAASPLEGDVLVVDEASMLDVVLAHHLLKALPDRARLVLVGDVDQLPSVGPGRVLEDLIQSGAVAVARLTEIFRQARASRIVVNAHRVRAGELPVEDGDADGDFFFIARSDPEAILATVKELLAERIPRRFGFDPRADVQVLTPMQKGLLGAANLNAELQALLNPKGDAITRGSRLLRVGDRVMQTRNNYLRDVFNGDLGRIASIDLSQQRLRVDFDGRSVEYEPAELDELVLAYATSIHKSQGSEYPCVVVPLHTQHYTLLQRNLLYTAITRGRRLVVVVGSRKALALAVKTETTTRRYTLLARRLAGDRSITTGGAP